MKATAIACNKQSDTKSFYELLPMNALNYRITRVAEPGWAFRLTAIKITHFLSFFLVTEKGQKTVVFAVQTRTYPENFVNPLLPIF